MARSRSFLKKLKAEKKRKKKIEKQQKKEERKKNSPGGGLENMLAYVDEWGNPTSAADPVKSNDQESADIAEEKKSAQKS